MPLSLLTNNSLHILLLPFTGMLLYVVVIKVDPSHHYIGVRMRLPQKVYIHYHSVFTFCVAVFVYSLVLTVVVTT